MEATAGPQATSSIGISTTSCWRPASRRMASLRFRVPAKIAGRNRPRGRFAQSVRPADAATQCVRRGPISRLDARGDLEAQDDLVLHVDGSVADPSQWDSEVALSQSEGPFRLQPIPADEHLGGDGHRTLTTMQLKIARECDVEDLIAERLRTHAGAAKDNLFVTFGAERPSNPAFYPLSICGTEIWIRQVELIGSHADHERCGIRSVGDEAHRTRNAVRLDPVVVPERRSPSLCL